MAKKQFRIAFVVALVLIAPVQSWSAAFCLCDDHEAAAAAEHGPADHSAPMAGSPMPDDSTHATATARHSMEHPTMDHELVDLEIASSECGHSGAACECNACGAFSGVNSADSLTRIFVVQSAQDIVDLYVAPPHIPTHPPPIQI